MIELIQKNRPLLEVLCKKYNVARLEVFGSAATGKFDEETSDLDFLVEFLPLDEGRYADAYFGLLFGLEELFGRQIDLVMPEAIHNQYFLQAINQYRETLYAA